MGFFKKLLSVAAPVLGFALGGPAGAAIGGGLAGAAQGGVKGALIGAGLGYAGGSLAQYAGFTGGEGLGSLFGGGAAGLGQTLATDAFIMGGPLAYGAAAAPASAAGFGLPSLASAKSALSLGSGLYGLYQSQQMQKLARESMERQDPFGPQRAQYQGQLSGLMGDPSSIVNTPGYGAGIEAVNRGMAAGGYLGSGNQMAGLQRYGGQFYNDEIARLASLSGANIQPGYAGTNLLTGNIASNALASQSLGTLGTVGRL